MPQAQGPHCEDHGQKIEPVCVQKSGRIDRRENKNEYMDPAWPRTF